MLDHVAEYAEKLTNFPTDLLKVQPIDTLTPAAGMVLLIRNSGYTTTPYAVHVGFRDETGRVLNHERESIEGLYGESVIAWTAIPFCEIDVETAVSRATPAIREDVQTLHTELRDIVLDRASFGKGRRTMLALQKFFDDKVSPIPHHELTPAMSLARQKVQEWVDGEDTQTEDEIHYEIQKAFA